MVSTGRSFLCFLFFLLCGCAALLARSAGDVRFSATLTPDLLARTGLGHLTTDNVAVIDGLVRQDEAASRFKNNDVDHTRFSARRTPREREISGLGQLTATQVALLDNLVGQRLSGVSPVAMAVAATASSPRPGPGSTVKPSAATPSLDLHGEIGFTYGWGEGGSFSGGNIILTHDDPAGRYSILVGYSQYQGKGLPPCYYPGYGRYHPAPGVIPMSR